MSKNYLLGIDIGTSACKVAVFDRNGQVMAYANGDYPVYYPREGWVQQNPEEWWQAVCGAIKECLSKGEISPEQIAGVGIDGQSWSAIAIDKDGNVLTDTPIWMDTRAQEICDRLNDANWQQRIFLKLPVIPFSLPILQRRFCGIRRICLKYTARIYKILQSNSFIAYRLTGAVTQDLSQGYGLHCFDMRTGTWDAQMCDEAGNSNGISYRKSFPAIR